MAELARGAVGDRPWGRTLAALAARGLTGQVTAITDGKAFKVAFEDGAVVAASSPVASDSAARVALTLHLVSSTQVAELARRAAANPNRDEIEVVAEYVRLAPDQAMRLRRRLTAHRAARTFAIDRGDFVIEDRLDLLVVPGAALDVRGVIYMGASQHLGEQRLVSDLAKLGSWFKLKQECVDDLPQYGFGEAERPVIQALVSGAAPEQLDASTGVDPRTIRAVIYALACAGACDTDATPQRATPVPSRIVKPQPPPPAATPMPDTFSAARTAARQSAEAIEMPTLRRELTLEPATSRKVDAPTTTRRVEPPGGRQSNAIAGAQALITARLKILDAHADHFTLLGVTSKSTDDEIRKAYFGLARQLHPDRLASIGLPDEGKHAQRLFAQVNTAFGILSDPAKRMEYENIQKRGGQAAIAAEQAHVEALANRAIEAEEAFRRGEIALKRDAAAQAVVEFKKAVELDPDAVDYQTLLAWAQFCAAPDKAAQSQQTKQRLMQVITKQKQAPMPRFYYARVERMLGRDQEALKIFKSVLQLDPSHAEAIAEVRVLESRLRR